jgi:t-SNARE complex subunit (syntaxin)
MSTARNVGVRKYICAYIIINIIIIIIIALIKTYPMQMH